MVRNNYASMTMPADFGEIYASQYFCSYVIVSNVSNSHTSSIQELTASNVRVEVVLGVRDKTFQLRDCTSSYSGDKTRENGNDRSTTNILRPGDLMDMIVQQKLDQTGEYTLQVTVRYQDGRQPGGPERVFRKIFRFDVGNAIEVMSVKQMKADEYEFVQLTFRNLLRSEITVEEFDIVNEDGTSKSDEIVRIDRVRSVDTKSDKTSSNGHDASSSFDVDELCADILQPNATRRMVLRLKKRPVGERIGTGRILWRSEAGVPGEFMISPPLYSSGSLRSHVHVVLTISQERLVPEEATRAVVRVSNNKTRDVRLRLVLNQDHAIGLAFVGLTSIDLGVVSAGETIRREIVILPTAAGFLELKPKAVGVVVVVDGAKESEMAEGYFLGDSIRVLCTMPPSCSRD